MISARIEVSNKEHRSWTQKDKKKFYRDEALPSTGNSIKRRHRSLKVHGECKEEVGISRGW